MIIFPLYGNDFGAWSLASKNTSKRETESASASAGFDALLAAIKANTNVDGMLHPAIERLEAYDRENQADFLRTLEVYLENDCNAQKCGRILFLHRNSLVYRIRRVQEIAECDLSDPNERAYLRLSFLLRK